MAFESLPGTGQMIMQGGAQLANQRNFQTEFLTNLKNQYLTNLRNQLFANYQQRQQIAAQKAAQDKAFMQNLATLGISTGGNLAGAGIIGGAFGGGGLANVANTAGTLGDLGFAVDTAGNYSQGYNYTP